MAMNGVTDATLRLQDGARFYADEVKLSRIELGKGSVFDERLTVSLGAPAGVTPVMLFNGGIYRLNPSNCGYNCYNVPSVSIPWSFLLGENGGTVRFDHVDRWGGGHEKIGFCATFSDDPDAVSVGTLHFRMPCTLTFSKPCAVSGDIWLDDGWFAFAGDAAAALGDGTMFGRGRIDLGMCVLDFGLSSANTIRLGASASSSVIYRNVAAVIGRGNNNPAQTVVFGNGTSPALCRDGKGAALILVDDQHGTAKLDGDGAKFKADGSVALDPNTHLVKDPVFSSVYRGNNNESWYHQGFLTYDNERGFVEFDDYVDDFTAGASSVVLVSNDCTLAESATVGALALRYRNLTIAEGVTLKVGPDDADRTAHVIFDSDHDGTWTGKNTPRILGAGTLDFGRSEGVFFAGRTDTGLSVSSGIGCRLTGTGGMTFVGSPFHSANGFSLSVSNDYSGGTWVSGTELRVLNSGALSTGDVHLAPSRIFGGGLRFVGNLEIGNDIFASGYGPSRGRDHTQEFGAIIFNNGNTVIKGHVVIDDILRVSCTPRLAANNSGSWTGGTGEFRGVISGGRLDISCYDLGSAAGTLPRVVLSGANTYSGGTLLANHTLVLKDGGTFGTGPVMLCTNSVISVESDLAISIPNDFSGKGTIRIAGAGDVVFRGTFEKSEYTDIALDLAGTNPRLSSLPPVNRIFNSSGMKTTLTLTADTALDPAQLLELGTVNLVLDGATLDLSGRTVDVRRLTCQNGGKVVNGTVNELNPAKGLLLIVR